jgi:hypothetical protein
MACNLCGWPASKEEADRLLESKEETEHGIAYIDQVTDFGLKTDATQKIRRVRPPHPHHGVAMRICTVQFELYSQMSNHGTASKDQLKSIECREGIHGSDYCNNFQVFCMSNSETRTRLKKIDSDRQKRHTKKQCKSACAGRLVQTIFQVCH